MTYLDHGATSFRKPAQVYRAVQNAMLQCANPGRGGHAPAMEAAKAVFACRDRAASLFDCTPEQVVFTHNCTHGLNIAIGTLVKPEAKVLVTGFEHNAVTRPLHARNAKLTVAGRRLFDQADTLQRWEDGLKAGVDAAVFTHCSNVFGYILPVQQMAQLCRAYGVPFIVDAAQSAGTLPVSLEALGADFIAMPGHKGLLGPQGTGLLLCAQVPKPLLHGGTGTDSVNQQMPQYLPEAAEAGTLNVPGIAGLDAGMAYVQRTGLDAVFRREHRQTERCAVGLEKLGLRVFAGRHQSGTVSFVPETDCEEFAGMLGQRGIAVRAGLHCAPLAHESAGTLETGTVRISFGQDARDSQTDRLLQTVKQLLKNTSR